MTPTRDRGYRARPGRGGAGDSGRVASHSPVRLLPFSEQFFIMLTLLRGILLVYCFEIIFSTDPACVIELECPECVPDNMPLVTSHRATDGTVTAASGDEVVLSCGGGEFAAYPALGALAAVCEAGRYRVRRDGTLRHLLDLGCRENVFEDVPHDVEHCGSPLQGRSYRVREAAGRVRVLASLCFDAERGVAVRASTGGALPSAARAAADEPLSLLGSLSGVVDARTRREAAELYSDDERLGRRLRELLRHERVSLARQTLTSAALLGSRYFDDQNVRAADFASNKVAVWGSVADGNLRHLQRDVARLVRRTPGLEVFAGTHGVLSLRTGGKRTELFLRARGRFPVPRYVWTAVLDRGSRRALALVLLNDPLVAVSEVREAVFCESACARVSWLHDLLRNRNYESPVYGLVFCCGLHNFASVVTAMPPDVVKDVISGNEGMLTDTFE